MSRLLRLSIFRMTKEARVAAFLLLLGLSELSVKTSVAFMPNQKGHRLLRGSLTHKKLTSNAVKEMANIYMADHPETYPNPHQTLAGREFRWALKTFERGATIPDTEDELLHHPPAHFDAEQIAESNQRMIDQRDQVISALNGAEVTKARELTGQILHTLQDFYSHSNWVEMGNTGIHPALADPEQQDDIGTVAGIDDPTCTDCGTETCYDNIRSDIISGNILTSGYSYLESGASLFHPTDYKPEGKSKCSHGGQDDQTQTIPATGGINKDTKSDKYSPHHYNHEQAAAIAEDASLEFLKSIRAIRSEDEFAKFLGLTSGSSLCFIIDTTGSMSDEIAAVKEVAINITKMSASGDFPPSEYVLVPFNDPDYGPVYITTDPQEMVWWLGNITVHGGGDEPELFFHGTVEALGAVRPRSTCYGFTDAPAKDEYLEDVAECLADFYRVEVTMLLTGGYSLRTADSNHQRRRKRQTTGTDYYDRLAMASGGQVIRTTKADISEAVKIIMVGMNTTEVTLLQKDNLAHTSPVNHSLAVDESLTDVVISINGNVDRVDIINVNGVVETPGLPDSGANVVIVSDVSTMKIYSLRSPQLGLWTVQISSSTVYSISVTARSLVSFSYDLVTDITRGHGGYRTVDNKPASDGEQIIVVKIEGGVPEVRLKADSGLGQITRILLVSVEGAVLQSHPPVELEPSEEYEIRTTLPDEGFRVVIEGVDSKGNKLQRCDPVVVTKTAVTLTVNMDSSGRFTAAPGDILTVNITVNNSSPYGDTFSLNVTDTELFFKGIVPDRLTLNSGSSGTAAATFQVPSNVSLGVVSTVSVICTGSGYSNYASFQIDTSSPVIDTTAPVCKVVSSGNTGTCSGTLEGAVPCHEDRWYMEFTAQDAGLGLHSVKTYEAHPEGNLTVEPFQSGTRDVIAGVYTSDCCKPSVTVMASDVLGNVGRCHVEYDTTPDSGTSKPRDGLGAILIFTVIMLIT